MAVVSPRVCLLVVAVLVASASARIERLKLEREQRSYFLVSSFGLLYGGQISLTVEEFSSLTDNVASLGFTIHRSTQKAMEYNFNLWESQECYLSRPKHAREDDVLKLQLDAEHGLFNNVSGAMGGVDLDVTDRAFTLWLKSEAVEERYTIGFHLCPKHGRTAPISITLLVDSHNAGPEYYGAGLAALPTVYAFMAAAFAICAATWVSLVFNNWPRVRMVHHLMTGAVTAKALSLLFHAVDAHFIATEGAAEEGWAITWYILRLTKGLLLFATALLVGAGFGFVKHVLTTHEKILIAVVLVLQVFSNIALVFLDESAEGSAQHSQWRLIALLIDLLGCGAILFPLVWSIRHVRAASESDGKAAASLAMLRLFRRLYILVLIYVYFTRVAVYVVETSVPFRYEYWGALLDELGTLIFFVNVGEMLSPDPANPYFSAADEPDEEREAAAPLLGTALGAGLRATKGEARRGRDSDA